MEVYTIGFTKKTAAEFFGILRHAGIRRLLDVRLHNSSQLAGFTKQSDLPFFLRELCQAEYVYEQLLAPTSPILAAYRKGRPAADAWEGYQRQFLRLMAERRVEDALDRSAFEVPTALLCSEPTAERCHRRLALEYLASKWGDLAIQHL